MLQALLLHHQEQDTGSYLQLELVKCEYIEGKTYSLFFTIAHPLILVRCYCYEGVNYDSGKIYIADNNNVKLPKKGQFTKFLAAFPSVLDASWRFLIDQTIEKKK